MWAAHALEVQRAEHDAKLAPIHVVFARIAVPHGRAEQHFDEQWIGDCLAEHLTSAKLKDVLVQVVVIKDLAEQTPEVVALTGKRALDFGFEQLDVVVKAQVHAGKGNQRSDLRGEREVFPRKAQLPQKPYERAFLGAFRGEIRYCMQSDVIVAPPQAIERVQAADRVVPLEDADSLLVVGESDARRETREAGADDNCVIHGSTTSPRLVFGTITFLRCPSSAAPDTRQCWRGWRGVDSPLRESGCGDACGAP